MVTQSGIPLGSQYHAGRRSLVKEELKAMFARSKGADKMPQQNRPRIVMDPKIHFGKPCVAGTRITVEDVLALIQEGIPFGA